MLEHSVESEVRFIKSWMFIKFEISSQSELPCLIDSAYRCFSSASVGIAVEAIERSVKHLFMWSMSDFWNIEFWVNQCGTNWLPERNISDCYSTSSRDQRIAWFPARNSFQLSNTCLPSPGTHCPSAYSRSLSPLEDFWSVLPASFCFQNGSSCFCITSRRLCWQISKYSDVSSSYSQWSHSKSCSWASSESPSAAPSSRVSSAHLSCAFPPDPLLVSPESPPFSSRIFPFLSPFPVSAGLLLSQNQLVSFHISYFPHLFFLDSVAGSCSVPPPSHPTLLGSFLAMHWNSASSSGISHNHENFSFFSHTESFTKLTCRRLTFICSYCLSLSETNLFCLNPNTY